MIESIKWQTTCCAWHGEYAEHTTGSGKILRIKRGPSVDGYLVMVFQNNQCETVDADGTPTYENVNESKLAKLMV
jgi:hypothetical protein